MMYTDEYGNKRSNGLGGFLIRFLIVAAFVGLLLWLYPIPEQIKLPNLKTFYNDVFNRNVQYMRDSAVNYYTVDKLPTVDNETYTMTLQEMLDKKIILPFTDKKGEACDTEGSYVSVTKVKDKVEYKFKYYLSCPASNQRDYLLEYRGCYDLCTTCTTPQKTKVIKIVKQPIGEKKEDPDEPRPTITARANSCTITGTTFGSATITVARLSGDPAFDYTIRVRQPGAWFYTTIASGRINSSNPSDTRTVSSDAEGNIDYQVLIDGAVYRSGTLSMDECRLNVPEPAVTTRVNSCAMSGTRFGSAALTITRDGDDPAFDYTMRVRQPGAWFFTTIDSGRLTPTNSTVTRTINGVSAGDMDYQILINGVVYRSGTLRIDECNDPVTNPVVSAEVNSCAILGTTFDGATLSISRDGDDPAFTYSMRVRQPGSSTYTTIASGTLTAANPTATRTVNGTAVGTMYYQFLVNNNVYASGSLNIIRCDQPEYEYLLSRTTSSSYWTGYSDWSLTTATATSTRRVQTIDFYRGYKYIPAYVYEYQHSRTVNDGYTAWSAWSAWSRTSTSVTATRDVDTRTVTDRTQTGTRVTYGSWTWQRKERRSSMYSSVYNTGSSSTATEYRQYLGTVVVRECNTCSVRVYYEYSIYTRSRNETPIYSYGSHKEYRYRTRSVRSHVEYIWSASRTISGWTYTYNYRIAADNGHYVESGWLQWDDWYLLIVDGYTQYQHLTYYTYSDLVTTSDIEYMWSRTQSVPGWTYTGTYREI